MNMSGIQSFIFGKGTDTPTYEDVKAKRVLQERLMSSLAGSPAQNVGQGIAAIGKAIGARRAGNAANEGETGFRNDANESMSALQQLMMGGMGGGMGGTASTMGAPGPTGTPPFMPADNSTDMGAAAGNGPGLSYGLPDSIVRTESGGNWNALNSEGYGGRGQFGEARLADAARAGIIPAGMTGAEFSRAPQNVQLAVENWHKQDILGELGGYVGQDIDGAGPIPPLTEDSILAVAHLGGTGGARRFVESGGQYNPSDSNGTSLSDYATTHAGGGMNGTVSTQGAPGQSMGYNPEGAQMAMQILDNPYASEGQKALAGLMMQRMMQAPPSQMDQIALQKAQLELQQMQNPQPDQTSGMQEYEYARNQGFEGSFLDYQTAKAQAGRDQTTVNNNMGGEQGQYLYGTDGGVPAGWRVDTTTGEASPIPGGPVTVEDQAAQDQDALTQAGVERSTNIVQEDIGRALGIIEQSPRWTTGLGARLAAIPGTDAKSLSGLLETIKANVGFDRLQQMRDASPTGGALGGINESEMRLLQSVIGNLDQSLDAEDLAYNLNRVNDVYLQIVNGPSGQPTPGAAQTQPTPYDPQTPDFEQMSDEELQAYIAGGGQ